MTHSNRALRASLTALAIGLSTAAAAPALAQSRQVTTPNIATAAGDTSVTVGGVVFTNKGLQGAGRLDANTRDFRNETLGSFSGMAMDLSTWRRNADGSYAGASIPCPIAGRSTARSIIATASTPAPSPSVRWPPDRPRCRRRPLRRTR